MSDPQPDWDKLPSNPIGFFELKEGFDRKDLKRAYTRLIRFYKPERHPEEFRRIREAYDLLDERIRYFGAESLSVPAPNLRVPDVMPDDLDEDGPAENPDPTPEIEYPDAAKLFAEVGASGTRTALRQSEHLDARGWCHLALLEESLGGGVVALCRTLIDGLIATDGAAELFHMLRGATHDDVSAKDAAELLVELTRLVSGPDGRLVPHQYWFLSEPLWLQLPAKMPFEEYAMLLERCSRKVGERGHAGRLVLLTSLLRRAALRADDEWLQASLGEIEQSFSRLDPWQQNAVDLAVWLLEYRAEKDDYRERGEFHHTWDDALTAIVEGDELESDRLFLEAQIATVDQPDEFFDEYHPEEPTHVSVQLLYWYADEFGGRRGEEPRPNDGRAQQSVAFARRLMKRGARKGVLQLWSFLSTALFLLLVAAFALPVLYAFHLKLSVVAWSTLAGVVALIATGFVRGWFGRLFDLIAKPLSLRLYENHLRHELADFLEESRVPLPDVVNAVAEMNSAERPLEALMRYAPADVGLHLYSLSLRFV